jgi:putative ABC transport system permease protein
MAPNHFVMNIQSYEVEPLQQFFKYNEIPFEGLYPMVRGRVSHINGVAVDTTDKSELDPALKRELNLSWADKIQANNKLTDGSWWTAEEFGMPLISVEKELARRLGVGIGDELTFQVSDQSVSARIKNLREVQWDSFQPNFYVIFPSRVIEQYPASFISSFYLSKKNKNMLNSLVRSFPTLTVLEVDAIIAQVQTILQQVSKAVEYVMLFVLFSGMMVLVASMQSSMDERIHNAVLMRTLGAKKSFLQNAQLSEFVMLGLFSGLLAVLSAELIAYLLYTKIFSLTFELHGLLWLAGPVISVILIILLSYLYMRNVTRQSPLKILRYS